MIITSLDFDRPGKHQCLIQVPCSHNLGGWANAMISTTNRRPRKRPTVLVLGGPHGDKCQRQIALMKLAHERVTGRIILISLLNFPAPRAATRLSPLDGMNMKRAFPCAPGGVLDVTSIEGRPRHDRQPACSDRRESSLGPYLRQCPIAGQLADRFSKRLLVVLSHTLRSIFTIATGFAGAAVIMLSLGAAMGIFERCSCPPPSR